MEHPRQSTEVLSEPQHWIDCDALDQLEKTSVSPLLLLASYSDEVPQVGIAPNGGGPLPTNVLDCFS
jgi:hypothetical protein